MVLQQEFVSKGTEALQVRDDGLRGLIVGALPSPSSTATEGKKIQLTLLLVCGSLLQPTQVFVDSLPAPWKKHTTGRCTWRAAARPEG